MKVVKIVAETHRDLKVAAARMGVDLKDLASDLLGIALRLLEQGKIRIESEKESGK